MHDLRPLEQLIMILVVAKHDLKGTELIDVKPRNWLNAQGATGDRRLVLERPLRLKHVFTFNVIILMVGGVVILAKGAIRVGVGR